MGCAQPNRQMTTIDLGERAEDSAIDSTLGSSHSKQLSPCHRATAPRKPNHVAYSRPSRRAAATSAMDTSGVQNTWTPTAKTSKISFVGNHAVDGTS